MKKMVEKIALAEPELLRSIYYDLFVPQTDLVAAEKLNNVLNQLSDIPPICIVKRKKNKGFVLGSYRGKGKGWK